MAILSPEDGSVMCASPSSPHAPVEVKWMVSSNVSCTVEVGRKCKVAKLMAQVEEKVGIPIEEQNLYVGTRQLQAIDSFSALDCDNLQLVRAKHDPRDTNLASFHKYVDMKTLEKGQFTYVSKLGEGAGAVVSKYTWFPSHGNSIDVAVKTVNSQTINKIRWQETNERNCHMQPERFTRETEDPLAEIGVLQYLASQQDVPDYLLRVADVFEGDQHVWIVMEFADDGDLFDLASQGNPTENEIFRYTWQLLQALAYLHQHYIGHRDVSLENLVLKNGTAKLMDFGASVRSHSCSGQVLRYFSRVGKQFYQAPECYVPHVKEVSIFVPPKTSPESIALLPVNNRLVEVRIPAGAVAGRFCSAEVWGYSVPPADMFAAGMCLFMLLFKTSAFSIATLDDAQFYLLHHKKEAGLKEMLRGWNIPPPSKNSLGLLCDMLVSNPSQRPSAVECLKSPCFESIQTNFNL